MTLLELYYGLNSGEIKINHGICWTINMFIGFRVGAEFRDIMMYDHCWLSDIGTFTPERETFLLLFAAYKGEL